MGLLDILKKPNPKPTSETLRAALEADDADVTRAEERVEALERRRSAGLLDGTDDRALAKMETEIIDARRHIERLNAARSRAAEMIVAAQAEEEEAQRRDSYDRAAKRVAEGKNHFAAYERDCLAMLRNLLAAYQIEADIHDANAYLPSGATPIVSPQQVMRQDARHGGAFLTGVVDSASAHPDLSSRAPDLTASIELPALKMGDAHIFKSLGGMNTGQPGSGAHAIVERLRADIAELEARL